MCAPCARQRPVADECVEGAVRRRSPLSGPHGLGPLWNRASGITTSQPCLLLFSILHSSLASTLSSLYHFIFVQTLCSPTFAGRFGDSCKPKQEDSKYPIQSHTTQLSVRQLHLFKSTHFFHSRSILLLSVCFQNTEQMFLHTDVTPTPAWSYSGYFVPNNAEIHSTVGTAPNGYATTDTYVMSEYSAGKVGGVNTFMGNSITP